MTKEIFKKIKENKMMFISIIAILFIPALYAGNFISAFADPYSNMSDVKVAVVNNDETIINNNEEVNIGKEFINALKENNRFKWEFVTEEQAVEGMKNNEYYFTVKIPADFTSNIYSTLNGRPKEANLIYITNDNNNYISGVLGGALVTELNSQLNQSVINKFVTTLGTNLDNVSDLQVGVTSLVSGSKQLTSGLSDALDGSKALNESVNSLNEAGQELKEGTNTLNEGYKTFNSKLNTASSSLTSINSAYTSLNQSLNQYDSSIESAINTNPNLTSEQKTALITSYKTIMGTSNILSSNLNTVTTGVTTLNTNSAVIATNINKISTGTSAISDYLAALNGGTNDLYKGIQTAYLGSSKLTSGLKELDTGVTTLNTSIDDLNLVDNASNISNPVKEVKQPYSEVKNYGYGFAPYFVSLGLFVGALVTTIVLTAKDKKSSSKKVTVKRILKRVGLFALVVVGQSLILDTIILANSITVSNPVLFIVFTLLISLTFMALIQMLSTLFNDVGRFVSIIILILQLTACGGTFPIETAPKFYVAIHNLMPMTYTVDGLRTIIGNGNMSILGNATIVLFSIFIVCNGIIVLYFKNSKKYN